ncbi:hypothetical protein SH1V18_48540 [Vallitalea longa]|uniref:SLH domain-containing protein n=1 Tax=Vallitalea longa TaxID=2936439 RepID=A0A9W6DIY5_9FIRM|nr:S-layer homology domain-containing protein [Vallitalea longa]GKX32374.1 hypothetical protein SH1V18_48540 [Vallitalea longa]
MKKSIVLIILLICLTVNTMGVHANDEIIFSDVPEDNWATQNIKYLVSNNVINGFPDGTFKPSFNINKDAFIKMAVTALGYTNIENDSKYWATNYINKAIELGLIKEDQFFNYQEPITREEMASIIAKAIDDTGNEKARNLIEDYVKDFSSVSYYYKEDVKDAYLLGIITGLPDGTFKPQNYSTRAEASAIIHRMMDKWQRKPFRAIQEDASDENDNDSSVSDNNGHEDNSSNKDNGNEVDERNNGSGTEIDEDTQIEYVHRVEDGEVIYSSEKIMKILKEYPLTPNQYSNDFEENNRICTKLDTKRMGYTQASKDAKEFIETLFTRDYKKLDKEKYAETLLYWLRAWWNYRDTSLKPKEFTKLWVGETEKWKVQQDIIFVTDSYRMGLINDRCHEILRGRLYFRYNNHENPDNIKHELELPEQMYSQVENLQMGKWYYVDVDVEMGRPMTNLNITWETSKYMLHSYHYLNDIRLVEGQ